MKKVLIYTTPTCAYCKMTKDFFQDNNVNYEEKDVSQDTAAREDMVAKSHQLGVPVIDIDGEMIVGFDRDKLAELLELK